MMTVRSLSVLLLALFALFAGPGPVHAENVLVTGQPAPLFSGTDTNGNTINLADYRGKTVILEWTNHECPYVRKHYGSGNMQALQKEMTDKGYIWLSIASSAPGHQGYTTPAEANAIMENVGAHATARILDPSGEIGHLYNARTTPHMFIIDPQGTLVYQGAIDDIPSARKEDISKARNYVRSVIADLEAGQPIAEAETRPYGCFVKYAD